MGDGRGYDGKGNHAEHYRPMLWFVSEQDLIDSADGLVDPSEVNPYQAIDLTRQFPELAFAEGRRLDSPCSPRTRAACTCRYSAGMSRTARPTPSSPCSPSPGEPETYWAVHTSYMHCTAVMAVLVVAMFSIMGCAGKASPPPAPQVQTVEGVV